MGSRAVRSTSGSGSPPRRSTRDSRLFSVFWPTGFWKAAGYFDEVTEKKLTKAQRTEQVMKEAEKAAEATTEVAVTSMRTADSVVGK